MKSRITPFKQCDNLQAFLLICNLILDRTSKTFRPNDPKKRRWWYLYWNFHNEGINICMAYECLESNNSWKEMINALKGIIKNYIPLTLELCVSVCRMYIDIHRSIGKIQDINLKAVSDGWSLDLNATKICFLYLVDSFHFCRWGICITS